MSLKRLYHLTHQRMKKAATTIIPRPFGRTVTLCTFDQCLHCDMDSLNCFDYHSHLWTVEIISFRDCTRREKTWLCYLRTAKVQDRIRICAVWSSPLFFRYLLTCETARPKNAAFRQGLHCSRTLLNIYPERWSDCKSCVNSSTH